MSAFVLDASVAMSWCFEDEADAAGDAVLRRLAEESASVPGIWPLEVANVLLGAERRKRITAVESQRFLNLLEALPIEVDAQTASRASREILAPNVLGESFFHRGFRPRTGAGTAKPGFAAGFARAFAVRSGAPTA